MRTCANWPKALANDFVSDEAFDQMLRAWFGSIARVLEPGRSFYIWGGYASRPNENVLDLSGGSGSTLIAAADRSQRVPDGTRPAALRRDRAAL